MSVTSSKTAILSVARYSSFAALCLWVAPAGAQSSGGASSGGASGASGSGGAANAGETGNGGTANGGGGGQSGETGAGGASSSGGASCVPMTGSAGASAMNLVSNGTFDKCVADPWWKYANDTAENPADVTLAVTDGQLCATMTAGGKNLWDAIVGLSGVHLLANQYYHISFSVTADGDRTIKFKTGLGDAPYTDYFIESVPISTAAKLVDYTYLNLREDAAGQFQFQIGAAGGKVCFDNIVLEPVVAPAVPAYATPAPNGHPFKDYKALLKMGTAVDTPMFLSNPKHDAIVAGEFSMITPANSMKMGVIQPSQGVFDFTDTDALAAWAQQNNLEFHGHPLVWHTQAPSWLTNETPTVPWTRDNMIQVMYAHIDGLMTHYKGKFPYWDVVNEAIDQVDGAWTFRKTFWHDRIGDDFIDLAFQRAHMDDPDAILLYNDYNIEQKGNAKADRVFQLVQDMKTRGIPISAVGFQGHYFIEANGNTSSGVPNMQAIRDNMARYAGIGVEVHITECDFRIGKPLDDNKTAVQNKFYADLLQVCIDAPNCSHFTVWGLSDLDSWVPGTFKDYDYAHLWDKNLLPKPAYQAMANVFAQYNTDGTPVNGTGSGGTSGSAAGGASGANGTSGATATSGATGTGGATGTTPPGGSDKKSGGCAIDPRPSNASSLWAVAALGVLGAGWSRRRSQRARS